MSNHNHNHNSNSNHNSNCDWNSGSLNRATEDQTKELNRATEARFFEPELDPELELERQLREGLWGGYGFYDD